MSEPGSGDEGMRIELVYSPRAREVHRLTLRLPPGATIAQALQASGWVGTLLPESPAALSLGVWGRSAQLGDGLRDRDRVEIYRSLRVDPKEARRQRYKAHVARYPSKRSKT